MHRASLFALTSQFLLLLATPAPAGDCSRSRSVCYGTPIVAVQKAYVAPVYQQQYVVPYPVAVQVQQPYYFSALNESVIADAAAFRAYRLLIDQGGQPLREKAVPPQHPNVMPPAKPQARGVTTEVDPKLQAVVTKSCVMCHSGANTKGGLDLSDLATLSLDQRRAMSHEVMIGSMPKMAQPLSDEEAKLFVSHVETAKALAKKP